MAQFVDIPTRENNILDVMCTNIEEIVSDVSTELTMMSDHDIVKIGLGTDFDPSINQSKKMIDLLVSAV